MIHATKWQQAGMRSWLVAAWTVAAMIVFAAPVSAQFDLDDDVAADDATANESASSPPRFALTRDEIDAKLDEITSLEFDQTGLTHVAEEIGQRYGIQVVLDRRELEDTGIGLDVEITFSLKDVRLATALQLMLSELNLDYVVFDGYLMITPTGCYGLEIRIYPYAELLRQIGSSSTDVDNLINTVQATVEPTSWDIVGGEGTVQALGKLLIVSQTQQIHREIESLFDKLRAAPVAEGGASAEVCREDVPEGRSAWEMRVYSTHGMVAHELTLMLRTLLPEFSDADETLVLTVGRSEDQTAAVASGATLEKLGLPQGGWLVVGQRPQLHDRLAGLLGEGKLVDERDSAPKPSANVPGFGGGGGFGTASGGGGSGGGGGGFF